MASEENESFEDIIDDLNNDAEESSKESESDFWSDLEDAARVAVKVITGLGKVAEGIVKIVEAVSEAKK